jgi:threonine synthase
LSKFALACAACGRAVATDFAGLRCPACDGPLKVEPEVAALAAARPRAIPHDERFPGMWRYLPLLPVTDERAVVSLGEGRTPLVPSARLGAEMGLASLLFKDESRNPTGSFKDRMLSVGISRARELGRDTVAVQSSGNVAAAAAAYAARAGLRAKIFVPRTVPEQKLLQALVHGADLFRIDSDSPTAIFDLLLWACRELGWYLVSTAALYNPFTLEGARTIAYEIAEQTSFVLPDWIIAPVGGGGALGSLWRGFRDLQTLGLVERLPRMVGVQAAGCAPFVDAIRLGRTPQEAMTQRWPEIRTIAGAIADDVVFDAYIALPAVRESGGTAVAVSDYEILAAQRALAASEGLFVEPASATTLAALRSLVVDGAIAPGSSVCCMLSGTGLKDPASAMRSVAMPDVLPLDREAVRRRAQSA